MPETCRRHRNLSCLQPGPRAESHGLRSPGLPLPGAAQSLPPTAGPAPRGCCPAPRHPGPPGAPGFPGQVDARASHSSHDTVRSVLELRYQKNDRNRLSDWEGGWGREGTVPGKRRRGGGFGAGSEGKREPEVCSKWGASVGKGTQGGSLARVARAGMRGRGRLGRARVHWLWGTLAGGGPALCLSFSPAEWAQK